MLGNNLVWLGIATELTLVNVLIYVPFFQPLFNTGAFEPQNWLYMLLWTPSLLLADELRKAVVRRRERRVASKLTATGGA